MRGQMTGERIYEGSVKHVYTVPGRPELVRFHFTDRISVFDKWIPSHVPHKGEVLCRIAAFWFARCADLDIRTHFVEQIGPNEMWVRRVDVEPDYDRITRDRRNVLVPCEFIVRHYVAGSFFDRMQSGQLPGLAAGAHAYGERLPEPYCETSTKVESTDRLIDREEALAISKLTAAELDGIWRDCLAIDAVIEKQVAAGGLVHADGKKELGRDAEGRLMLVDVFGTPDEDRFWDAAALAQGEIREHSKELVRQHYRHTGYKDALYAARAGGEPEPDIPPMPEELIERTTRLYVELFERITGERFR